MKAPRWLGVRHSRSQDLQGPDAGAEGPLLHPLTMTNSDPMRTRSRESTGSNSSTPVKQVRQRASEGMLDRIAASFSTALSGLGIGASRSRENSNGSSGPEDQ